MNTVIKTIITTVLLSVLLATTSDAEARLKYYRYNANIPMVEMTLNMMVAMGVLEQIPGRLVHDGNPYNRMVRARSNRHSGSPYTLPANLGYYDDFMYDDFVYDDYDLYGRYDYRNRGYSPYRRYYDSPYGYADPYSSWDSPWIDSWGDPWNTSWGNPWNSIYGNQWYSPWSSPWGNRLNYPGGTGSYNPWGGAAGYPWGSTLNNPWISPWSNTMINPFLSPYGGVGSWSGVPGYSGMPISPGYAPGTQGYSPGYTPGTQGYSPGYTPGTQGYSPGYTPGTQGYSQGYTPGFSQGNTSTNSRGYGNNGTTNPAEYGRSGNAPVRTDNSNVNSYTFRKSAARGRSGQYREPSQSAYSGFHSEQGQRLDGLWIGESGEMLGIRGNDFLWYDGKERYAKGRLLKTPTMMKAKIERSNRVISIHYRLIDNELFTVSKDGKMRIFSRTPLMQQAGFPSGLYSTPSRYASDIATPLSAYSQNASGTATTLASYTSSRADTLAPLESHRGEHSPMWAPGASSAVVADDKAVPEMESSRGIDRARDRPAAGLEPVTITKAAVTTYSDDATGVRGTLASIMPGAANPALPEAAKAQRQSTVNRPSIAVYSQSHPVAGALDDRDSIWKPLTPYSTTQSYKNSADIAKAHALPARDAVAFEPSGAQAARASGIWSQSETGEPDELDTYPYLFSYLKDHGKDSDGQGRNVTDAKHSGNIWKPNESFSDTRSSQGAIGSRDSAGISTAASEISASYSVRKFVWPVNRDWY